MSHFLGGPAVHLCKDTAPLCTAGPLPSPPLCPPPTQPGAPRPARPVPRGRCPDLQDRLPEVSSLFLLRPLHPLPLCSALPGSGRAPVPRHQPLALSPAWHRRPVYPARQRQEKSVPRSSQVPPFTQGLRKQGEGAARSRGSLSAVAALPTGLWAVQGCPPVPLCLLPPSPPGPAVSVGLRPPYLSHSAARRSLGDSHTCICQCSGSRCHRCDRGPRHTSPASLGAEGTIRVRRRVPTTAAPPLVPRHPRAGAFTGTLLTSRRSGGSGPGPHPIPGRPGWQGPAPISQCLPVKRYGQLHWYSSPTSLQVPPFLQGPELHRRGRAVKGQRRGGGERGPTAPPSCPLSPWAPLGPAGPGLLLRQVPQAWQQQGPGHSGDSHPLWPLPTHLCPAQALQAAGKGVGEASTRKNSHSPAAWCC